MRANVFDPAHVLGCSAEEAQALLRGKRITPGEVESVALKHYAWRRHRHDPTSYWVTIAQAAEILGQTPGDVRRQLDERRLPHVVHASGVRLMRRQQIQALAGLQTGHRHRVVPPQRRAFLVS